MRSLPGRSGRRVEPGPGACRIAPSQRLSPTARSSRRRSPATIIQVGTPQALMSDGDPWWAIIWTARALGRRAMPPASSTRLGSMAPEPAIIAARLIQIIQHRASLSTLAPHDGREPLDGSRSEKAARAGIVVSGTRRAQRKSCDLGLAAAHRRGFRGRGAPHRGGWR